MICLDLFLAGASTTSNTLAFLFLEMIRNPEIQEKVATILRSAVPLHQPITYQDRLKVPYIDAVILESQRLNSVVPILSPKAVIKDTILEGYNIPKNATVLANAYSAHYDTEYWGDPHVFRPERFMNEKGQFVPGERVFNFGLGRRRCLGEVLARQCVFIYFTSVIRKYKLCPNSKNNMPSRKPIPGITLYAQDYKVKAVPR